jgi:hypothetical protein
MGEELVECLQVGAVYIRARQRKERRTNPYYASHAFVEIQLYRRTVPSSPSHSIHITSERIKQSKTRLDLLYLLILGACAPCKGIAFILLMIYDNLNFKPSSASGGWETVWTVPESATWTICFWASVKNKQCAWVTLFVSNARTTGSSESVPQTQWSAPVGKSDL